MPFTTAKHPCRYSAVAMMARPLKIAFFVTLDKQTGTYFRYHNLAIGLRARGHEVTVYSQTLAKRQRRKDEERDGVRYVLQPSSYGDRYFPFELNPGNIWKRYVTFFSERRQWRYDIYHLFQPFENAAWQWQWHRRRYSHLGFDKHRPLFVFDWDDLWCGGLLSPKNLRLPKKLRYMHLEYMEHKLPRSADLVTTCSSYLSDLAIQRGARDVEIVHNGIWTNADEANDFLTPSRVSALRQSFELHPTALYLGFVGWTSTESDWCLDVLQALKGGPTLPREVRLACAGYDLRQRLGDHPSLAERIDYVGNLPPAQARRLMQALDVGLLPFAETPFNRSRLPIKFAEYLAAGLSVLCGDVGEIGRLGRQMRGVVLLPSDRQGWVMGCVSTIRNLLLNGATIRPDKKQLGDTLGWPVLSARLENIYQKHLNMLG